MRTINQTVGDSRDLMFIVKIDMEGSYFYFNDLVDDLVLDSVHFDGKVLLKNSLSGFKKDIDCVDGGTIGQAGYGDFAVSRYNSYSGLSNFHKDIYPSTSKPNLTSKRVDIGLVWVGATSLSEVTWIWRGSIWFWKYNDAWIEMNCREFMEVEGKQLPPFQIQDHDSADLITYYPDAPSSSIGKSLPILYGDFSTLVLPIESFRLAPTLQIAQGYQFKATCHLCHTVQASSYMYEYLQSVQTVIQLSSASASNTNTRAGHKITIANRREPVLGTLYLLPRVWLSGGSNIDLSIEDDLTNYGTIDAGVTSKLKMASGLSEDELGQLDGTDTQCKFSVIWESADTVNGQLRIFHPDFTGNLLGGYHSTYEALAGSGLQQSDYDFGIGNASWATNQAKWLDVLAWTAKELDYLEFHIINQAGSNQMKVYHCWFTFTETLKYGRPMTNLFSVRNRDGERATNKTAGSSNIQPTELVNESQIFCYAKGLQYDSWIS